MNAAGRDLLDSLWRPSAIVTTVLAAEGLAIVLTLAPSTVDARWVLFGLWSLLMQWIALGTLGLLYLARNVLGRLSLGALSIAVMAGLLVATAVVINLGEWLVTSLLGPALDGALTWRLGGIAVTIGVFGMLALHNAWRARHYALQAKQSELEALRARVQPHFLFNTINTATALVRQDPVRAESVLMDMADLFRAALGRERTISLEGELALTRQYLAIEQARFGPRLQVHWHLPPQLPVIDVPVLSIQPLVENAVRHGVEPMIAGGDISIEVILDESWVVITVTNPLPRGAPRAGHGIGLAAVKARIAGHGEIDTVEQKGRHVATLRLALVPSTHPMTR